MSRPSRAERRRGTFDTGAQRRMVRAADERTTASAIVAMLSSEGRAVSDLKRLKPSRSGRTPDFAATVDGVTVAIEVVTLAPETAIVTAEQRIMKLDRDLRETLRPDAQALGGQLLASIEYSLNDFVGRDRPTFQADQNSLVAAIRRAAAETDRLHETEIETGVPWIARCELTLLVGQPASFFILLAANPEIAGFAARKIADKGDQHTSHAPVAILAVRATFDYAEELAADFAGTDGVPWWRVYQVLTGGNATLVFESTDLDRPNRNTPNTSAASS